MSKLSPNNSLLSTREYAGGGESGRKLIKFELWSIFVLTLAIVHWWVIYIRIIGFCCEFLWWRCFVAIKLRRSRTRRDKPWNIDQFKIRVLTERTACLPVTVCDPAGPRLAWRWFSRWGSKSSFGIGIHEWMVMMSCSSVARIINCNIFKVALTSCRSEEMKAR